MPYLTKLRTTTIDDVWSLLEEDLTFESVWFKIKRTAQRGLITDFASVPRGPFIYWLFGGRGKRPATNHDDDYAKQELPKWKVDLLFFEGLLSTYVYEAFKNIAGVNADSILWTIKSIWRFLISLGMYLAVAVFGYGTWWKYAYRHKHGLPLRPEAPSVDDPRWHEIY